MKKTVKELKIKLERKGTGQGNGTVEILLSPHIARWILRHSNIKERHILYLLGCRSLDNIINGG